MSNLKIISNLKDFFKAKKGAIGKTVVVITITLIIGAIFLYGIISMIRRSVV